MVRASAVARHPKWPTRSSGGNHSLAGGGKYVIFNTLGSTGLKSLIQLSSFGLSLEGHRSASKNREGDGVDRKVLTYRDLQQMGVAFSRTHMGRLIAAGQFPAPFGLGAGRSSRIAWDGGGY